ncbi:MAG: hypothetical protein FGM14_16545 [Flavobacteriales bacterium]|nr:hypothetical protein [Flavobacteriales bacterium]
MNNDLPTLNFAKKRTIAETCPCGKNNKDGKFTPYVGFLNCGYCHSCGQTFLPPIEQEKNTTAKTPIAPRPPKIEKPISFIDVEVFKKSLNNFDQNNFVKFLIERFGTATANKLISKYFLGTSKHWSGANVFWQIDTKGKIRTGKIMLYNATDGKRIKQPKDCVQWVHKVTQQSDFELKQCFFGEHLLNDKTKPVAIVESEKTALISSIYLPKFIWLATGGKTNLTTERMKVLSGRKVVLFPDLNCFNDWQNKANEFSKSMFISVSDLLERKATADEKKAGLDLADYLLKFDCNTPTALQPQQLEKQLKRTPPPPPIPPTEKQKIIKEVVNKNQDLSIEDLLQICINKCVFQSKSKAFNSVDFYLFNNELRLNNISIE